MTFSISTVLQIGLGLALVYYVLSLTVSYITSIISDLLSLRANDLLVGLRELITDETTRQEFLTHPLIEHLETKRLWSAARLEAVPAKTYTTVLFDILLVRSEGQDQGTLFDRIEAAVDALPEASKMRKALLSAIRSSEQGMANLREAVEAQFNNVIKGTSALYKQHARLIAAIVAYAVTWFLGVDSVEIAHYLWYEPSIRAVVAEKASQIVRDEGLEGKPEELATALEALDLPIFWWSYEQPTDLGGWISKVLGLTLSWAAVAQGSSFWYQVLKQLRSPKATSTAASGPGS